MRLGGQMPDVDGVVPHLQRAVVVFGQFAALQADAVGLPRPGHRKTDGDAVHEVRGTQPEDDLAVVAVFEMPCGITVSA